MYEFVCKEIQINQSAKISTIKNSHMIYRNIFQHIEMSNVRIEK